MLKAPCIIEQFSRETCETSSGTASKCFLHHDMILNVDSPD